MKLPLHLKETIERGDRHKIRSSRFPTPMKVMALAAFTLLAAGCHKAPPPDDRDILISVGDSVLTLSDVVSRIPVGLESADSAALFHKIVDKWVEGMVLSQLAEEKLPQLPEIERKVADYRNRLITTEYLKRMREGKEVKVSPDSIRSFYEAHRSEFVAETPLVKGIYIKVPANSTGLDDIRRCVFTADDASIDELERNWIGEALQYEFFVNTWIDWETIADQIPYRFYDPDAFLNANNNFETTGNGSVYLLPVSEFLPTGSEQPYDFAAPRIGSMMEQAKMASYEESLVKSLIKEAIGDHRLVAVGYDPVTHRMMEQKNDKKKLNQKDEKE